METQKEKITQEVAQKVQKKDEKKEKTLKLDQQAQQLTCITLK